MRLREFSISRLKQLPVFDGEKEYSGLIGETLKQIPHLAGREIKETRMYFDTFVIRLEGEDSYGQGTG